MELPEAAQTVEGKHQHGLNIVLYLIRLTNGDLFVN